MKRSASALERGSATRGNARNRSGHFPRLGVLLSLFLSLGALAGRAETNLLTLATNGAYTWYNDPRALFHNGALYVGCVRGDGASILNVLDLQSGATRTLWTGTWREFDDHDNSGLLPLQDGRLLAIYARHGGAHTFSYRLSLTANPTTPGAWGPEQTSPDTGFGLTYSNPYQLSNEAGKVYDFCRDINFNPSVLTSADSGAHWSSPRHFIKTGSGSTRPYVKYCSDYNSRIDFLYTDGHPRDVNNSLYHMYYQGGALYKTDGSFLKSFADIPLLHDSGERGSVIYQYSDADTNDLNDHIPHGRAWCWEIAYQTNGWPVCVFTVQRDLVDGSTWTGDRIYYYYARWTGTNWQKRFIAQAGQPLYESEDDYAGGIALDPEDPSIIYMASIAANPFDLSTTTNVPLGAHFKLYRGRTTDGGLTFAWNPVTTNSAVDNFRPYVPRNRQGVPALIWFRGSYPTFTSFNASVVGLFTNSFPRANLVSDWPLDAANGQAVPDTAGARNLNLVGGASFTTGVHSNAFSFDGSSRYLTAAHDSSGAFYQPGQALTAAFWVRGAPQTARYLVTESSTTNNSPLFLLQSGQTADVNNRLDLLVRPNSGSALINHAVSTRPVLDGTWHHVAYVDNAGAVQVYVDGLADLSLAYTPAGAATLNTTTLGALVRAGATGLFNGQLDDVLVWSRALSQNEVQSAMSNSVPPPPPPEPPGILFQSGGRTNASLGSYVPVYAQVLGDPPLSYQWLENGVPLPGATNNTLIASTTSVGSNWLALVVTNVAGSITGAPMPLVVLPDPPPDLATNLLSWWPLDEVSNSNGTLTSPDLYSHNDLTLFSMTAGNLVPGHSGNALSFAGSNQYAERTGGFPIYLMTNYTVSLWIKGAPGQANKQVFGEGGAGGNFFLLGTENSAPYGGKLNVKVSPGTSDLKSSRDVFDNSWHHVVWVDQNGRARLFIDGVLDETDFSYTRGNVTLENTALGALVRASPVNFFAGAVDDVAVWDRCLSYSEIQQAVAGELPPSSGPLPPAIFRQPLDQTNGIVAGDAVSFSVLATGTAPFQYTWRKDGVDIGNNPSAHSEVLSLPAVQTSDAGGYSVVVSNAAGAVTSVVAQLTVIPHSVVTNGVALLLDVDAAASPDTQDGFQSFTLDDNGGTFANAISVTVSAVGGATVADRLRATSPFVTDAPPAFTQARLYNDFIFANSTADGAGLDVQIARLAPNTPYGLTIWSFDPQSPNDRVSDWTEIASGTPVPIATGYTFNGSDPPAADYDDTFGALLTSSAAGRLEIRGVRHGGSSYGVFLNALRLDANPALRITRARIAANGNLELTVQSQYPGQIVTFQQTSNLVTTPWQPASAAAITATRGPFLVAEFPPFAGPLFYRAVGQ